MEISEKLLAIQMELKAPKGQFNDFGKYKYRSCEDILEALKPLLNKEELLLIITDEMVEVGGRVYVKATVTVKTIDGENALFVSAYAREPETQKGMSDSQITGACSSYARKYALNGLFAIDDTKDADATNKHNEETKDLLNFEQILEKYNSSKNIFELKARKKKYMTDVKTLNEKEIGDLKSAYIYAESTMKTEGGQE